MALHKTHARTNKLQNRIVNKYKWHNCWTDFIYMYRTHIVHCKKVKNSTSKVSQFFISRSNIHNSSTKRESQTYHFCSHPGHIMVKLILQITVWPQREQLQTPIEKECPLKAVILH